MFVEIVTAAIIVTFLYKYLQIHQKRYSLSQIPGPKSYPLIGTTYLYSNGTYSWDTLHQNAFENFKQFGPIVREDLLPGVTIVHLFNHQDIKTLFHSEGRYPSRRSHTALLQLRQSQPSLYNTGGLLPTNGPAWVNIRKPLQKPVSSAVSARQFVPDLDEVMQDVITYIHNHVDNINNVDFLPHIYKIFTEVTGVITLDYRFDCLHVTLNPNSTAAKVMDAADKINNNVLATDNSLITRFWKWESKPFKETKEGMKVLQEISRSFLKEKTQHMKDSEMDDEKHTLVEHWLSSPDIDINDVATAVEDFLLAGVHTSSYAASFLMYNLARNSEAQAKLSEECQKILEQSGGQITQRTVADATYAFACLKESLRIHPVAVGTGRQLNKDTTFSGYTVPAGTIIVAYSCITSMNEDNFPEPYLYKPERWLDGSTDQTNFAFLPFGYGQRVCIGKSIAETSLVMFLIRVFSQFRISWIGGDLDYKTVLINKPDAPLLFHFDPID